MLDHTPHRGTMAGRSGMERSHKPITRRPLDDAIFSFALRITYCWLTTRQRQSCLSPPRFDGPPSIRRARLGRTGPKLSVDRISVARAVATSYLDLRR